MLEISLHLMTWYEIGEIERIFTINALGEWNRYALQNVSDFRI